MARPLSISEEFEMLSEDQTEELPKCSACGESVMGKYNGFEIHKECWLEGKAEYEADRGK